MWAFDAVTYYWLEQLLQEKFYVVKWAVGGTSIAPDYNASKGRFWSAAPEWLAQAKPTSDGGNSLLLSFIQEIDMCIDKTLSRLKDGYQIDAFLWHQGESDYAKSKDYYRNLKTMVAYVRMHLTEKTGKDYSRLPFIFGTVARSNKYFSREVENAMKQLAAEDPNMHLIDMSGAELLNDRLHFTAHSAEYLGQQVYKQLEQIIKGVIVRTDELKGKRLGIIGDSYVKNHKEPVKNTWHYKFAEKHGMEYLNYGKNGSSIAYSSPRWGEAMYVRYKEMPDDLDYVIVVGGHNDGFKLDSIGGIDVFKERLGNIEGAVKYYDKFHRNFISQRLQHLKTRLSRHFNIDEQHIGLYAHHQILCRYRRRGCGNHLKIFQSCQIILQPVDALWFIVHNHNLNSILHVISF